MKNTTNTMNKFLSDIETELTYQIIWNIRHSRLSLKEAKSLAQDFRQLMPVKNKKELLHNLKSLCTYYLEACSVYAKYASSYDESQKKKILKKMRKYMQAGDIDKAVHTAKGGKI